MGHKKWVTLDNKAVVGDLNKCIENGGKIDKKDNLDIWNSVAELIATTAHRNSIKVTWTKGHTIDEDIRKMANPVKRNPAK